VASHLCYDECAYKPMVLVAYKPMNSIVLAGLVVMGMHFLHTG
jgi:hypothetical protein